LDATSFITQHTFVGGVYKPDFYFNASDETPTISVYWQCTDTGSASYDKRMMIPLPVAHGSTLTRVDVWGYWGGGTLPGTMTDRPRIELIEKDTYVTSNVTILDTAYASDMGVNTITLTGSYNIDKTANSYSMRFRTALANTTGVPYVYGARITYQITDLGAAIGTANQ
jgi:hypothetical protein